MIYAMQDAEGMVKIGFTARPVRQRRGQVQAARRSKVVVLGVAPGGRADEAEMHRRFAHLRADGEWFRPEPELLEWVRALGAEPEEFVAVGQAILSRSEIDKLLGTAVHLAGSLEAFCDKHDMAALYVQRVMSGNDEPSTDLLAALGIEKVTVYRRKGS
jgi:hypothetical protein